MPRPIAVRASVSMSRPERRLILGDRHGPVADRPDWVSLDVLVEVQLDDGTRVSTPHHQYSLGRPLDCSQRELAESVRSLIFSQPRYLPGDPRAEPTQLVDDLRPYHVETTVETLSSLPLTVTLADEVKARLERSAPTTMASAPTTVECHYCGHAVDPHQALVLGIRTGSQAGGWVVEDLATFHPACWEKFQHEHGLG